MPDAPASQHPTPRNAVRMCYERKVLSQKTLGYCWRIQKCRICVSHMPSWKAKTLGETDARKSTSRTLKEIRQQYPLVCFTDVPKMQTLTPLKSQKREGFETVRKAVPVTDIEQVKNEKKSFTFR